MDIQYMHTDTSKNVIAGNKGKKGITIIHTDNNCAYNLFLKSFPFNKHKVS